MKLEVSMRHVFIFGSSIGACGALGLGLYLNVEGIIADGCYFKGGLDDMLQRVKPMEAQAVLTRQLFNMTRLPYHLLISSNNYEEHFAITWSQQLISMNRNERVHSFFMLQRAARKTHLGYYPDTATIVLWVDFFLSLRKLPVTTPMGYPWTEYTPLEYWQTDRRSDPQFEEKLEAARNRNGDIEFENYDDLFDNRAVRPSTEQLKQSFSALDKNSDGTLTPREMQGQPIL